VKGEKMRSYLIYAPPFDQSSGGVVVLHRLSVELKKRGCNVLLSTDKQNPRWPKIYLWEEKTFIQNPEAIAIYPEIIFGNPFHTETVVRYLLNIPGRCGGPDNFSNSDNEMFYTYSNLFNTKLQLPPDHVMLIPHIDLNVFYDRHLKRSGRLKYFGKRISVDDPRLARIPVVGSKEGFRGDEGQNRLAEQLNKCEMLYCYDNATALTEIARLCGCPVVIIPDGSYTYPEYRQHEFWKSGGIGWDILESPVARETINSDLMRSDYEEAEKVFQKKLTDFIEITQKA
jgi:O-antigen biosynthesis protein